MRVDHPLLDSNESNAWEMVKGLFPETKERAMSESELKQIEAEVHKAKVEDGDILLVRVPGYVMQSQLTKFRQHLGEWVQKQGIKAFVAVVSLDKPTDLGLHVLKRADVADVITPLAERTAQIESWMREVSGSLGLAMPSDRPFGSRVAHEKEWPEPRASLDTIEATVKLVNETVELTKEIEQRIAEGEKVTSLKFDAVRSAGAALQERVANLEDFKQSVQGAQRGNVIDALNVQDIVPLSKELWREMEARLPAHDAQIAELYDLLNEASKVIEMQATALLGAARFGAVSPSYAGDVKTRMAELQRKLERARWPVVQAPNGSVPTGEDSEAAKRAMGKFHQKLVETGQGWGFWFEGNYRSAPNQCVTGRYLFELLGLKEGVQLFMRTPPSEPRYGNGPHPDDVQIEASTVITLDIIPVPEFYTIAAATGG